MFVRCSPFVLLFETLVQGKSMRGLTRNGVLQTPLWCPWRFSQSSEVDPLPYNLVHALIVSSGAAGPMAVYIVYLLVKNDPARHYWIVVISTAELYGGCVFVIVIHYPNHSPHILAS